MVNHAYRHIYNYDPAKLIVPMYAFSNNNTLVFHNITAILKLSVPVGVTEIKVSADGRRLNGGFTVANASDKYYANMVALSSYSENDTVITLTPKTGTTCFDHTQPIYIPIPAQQYAHFTVTLKNETETLMTKGPQSSWTPEVNKIYTLDCNSACLTKKFKVADNKYVYFTTGNLYYDGTNACLESAQSAYPSSWSTSHVGHFFYNNNIADASKSMNDFVSSTTNYLFCGDANHSLTINGTSGLHCLSATEWDYLYNHHTHSMMSFNGNTCLVIYPDGVSTISGTATEDELTQAGYLILPIAGYRKSNVIDYGNSNTRYWTSSVNTNDDAISIKITLNGITSFNDATTKTNGTGRCIRLVKDVQ